MERVLTVSDVARRLGLPPKLLSDLFYRRHLDDDRCPVAGGRRLIPEDYVPAVERELRRWVAERAGQGAGVAP